MYNFSDQSDEIGAKFVFDSFLKSLEPGFLSHSAKADNALMLAFWACDFPYRQRSFFLWALRKYVS